VVVGEDQVAAARAAVEKCGAELVVLDDGFQHAAWRGPGRGDRERRPAPRAAAAAGPLRESAAALGQAGVVVTMEGRESDASAFVPPAVPIVVAAARGSAVVTMRDGRWETNALDTLAGRDVAAVAKSRGPAAFSLCLSWARVSGDAPARRPPRL
jgi:tetraacyldisaccharide-1-P 4'-kinase